LKCGEFLGKYVPHLVFWSWSELAHGRCWSPLPLYQHVFLQVLLAGSGECCLCPRHCWSQPNDFVRFILTSVTFSSNLITGLARIALSFYSRTPYVTNDSIVMYDFGSWKTLTVVKYVKHRLRRYFQMSDESRQCLYTRYIACIL
jgi:hypothetical protein